ncbi:MAG: hypothetical protein CVT74_16300 [Alphaproteobacteria bacterium HGW-Alphaproteobacteria-13]|nr:MAG: hypothetical protein CVT74_16300 [Alphaproteobacteria bacterium HGW-Alphaproteobacteria-13]
MSGFDFDEVGEFGSQKDADDWARDNNIDPRDVDIKPGNGGKARVWIRRGSTRMSDIELRNSRDRGFL